MSAPMTGVTRITRPARSPAVQKKTGFMSGRVKITGPARGGAGSAGSPITGGSD